jgi:hypothetical protein
MDVSQIPPPFSKGGSKTRSSVNSLPGLHFLNNRLVYLKSPCLNLSNCFIKPFLSNRKYNKISKNGQSIKASNLNTVPKSIVTPLVLFYKSASLGDYKGGAAIYQISAGAYKTEM